MNPKVPKSLQNAPQGLPNPPEMLPKSTSDVTRSPLGDYVGPLIEKNLIFNAKKIAKRRPGAPRRPQNGVKFEVNFDFFFVFFSMLFFNQFWTDFSRLRTWKMWFPSRRNTNFCKIDVLEKSSKNHQFWDPFLREKPWKIVKKLESKASLHFFAISFDFWWF